MYKSINCVVLCILEDHHKVTSGCGVRQVNETLIPGTLDIVPGDELHAVRCCNDNTPWCETVKPCLKEKTFDEAVEICSTYTNSSVPGDVYRLCREDEEQHTLCCYTGCNIDRLQSWVADIEHEWH